MSLSKLLVQYASTYEVSLPWKVLYYKVKKGFVHKYIFLTKTIATMTLKVIKRQHLFMGKFVTVSLSFKSRISCTFRIEQKIIQLHFEIAWDWNWNLVTSADIQRWIKLPKHFTTYPLKDWFQLLNWQRRNICLQDCGEDIKTGQSHLPGAKWQGRWTGYVYVVLLLVEFIVNSTMYCRSFNSQAIRFFSFLWLYIELHVLADLSFQMLKHSVRNKRLGKLLQIYDKFAMMLSVMEWTWDPTFSLFLFLEMYSLLQLSKTFLTANDDDIPLPAPTSQGITTLNDLEVNIPCYKFDELYRKETSGTMASVNFCCNRHFFAILLYWDVNFCFVALRSEC